MNSPYFAPQQIASELGTAREVVDSRTTRIATSSTDQLVLVTCWPFTATAPRGPLRYVVTLAPM